ncbi:MAG: S9 family peptidase [Blastocatellia bacterium]|nr:S9 family peptidase [Blastocatellia bacterium]
MQRVRQCLLCFVIGFSLLAPNVGQIQAQTTSPKVPITHEMVWLMKRIGAPQPSPDGKWVVVSVTEPAYDRKDQTADLWIFPSDGSAAPRRLTATKTSESDLDWSPDSTRIAFSTKREGDDENQIYVLDIRGGEAQRVTSLSTGAGSPQWRPDGKALLFTSSVFPGTQTDEENRKIATERKNRKYKARVYDGFPIRFWDHWLEDTQTHLFVQSLEAGSSAKDILAGTKLVAQPGFGARLNEGGEGLDAVWSPDGTAIVFAATTERNKAAYAEVGMQLFQISATGGEPVQLTSGSFDFGNPSFSPDGKKLACNLSPINGKYYNLERLALYSWPNVEKQPAIVTASFDRSVGSHAFTPDSKTIYLTAEDAGHEKLYSVPTTGGEVKLVFDMALGVYTGLSLPPKAATPMLIANWESAVNPAEVVRIDLQTKNHSLLTHFNTEQAAKIDWQPLRHFWFTSKAGKRIHNMLVLPPGFDETKKYPLFVFMHGGPSSMWRDQFFLRWNYHFITQPGYVMLLTNYTGSTGFGEKFAQEIERDPLAGPAEEINQAADEALKQFPFIDGTRQAAGGASYGGHLANWMQATTTRYKCLIAHAGSINQESQWGTSDTIFGREIAFGGPVWEQGKVWREQNPARLAKNFRTPILVSVGEQDFRVPLNQSLETWNYVQRLRIPSRLIVFPEENHWILRGENNRFYFQEIHGWLKKYLLEP